MPAGIQLKGERTAVLLAGAAIVLAGIAAYGGSFSGVMLYDDIPSIVENSTIHHLWPLWRVLATPATGALTTSGRPVLALSFALNHAISGVRVWSYHALNLLIHLLAGLTLFGIVRRTIAQVGTGGPPVRAVPESKAGTDGRAARPYLLATSLAFSVALLWTVHPLQTEAITYIVQRAESLMGLFYLLTLYYFIRGAEKAARRESFVWFGLCWLACLFGMATKEVMATAPLMVLFYDRTFLAGTFGEACRRRGKAYAGLAGTWLVLAVLVASTGGNRGGSVGFGIAVKWWAYGLTQFEAVARYLWLSLWPHPLVFEYGVFWVRGAGEVVPYALPVLLLLAATIWGLLRPPHAGGAGRSFG